MPRDIQLAEKIRLLRQFWRLERRAPTYAEMLGLFDYKSKNAVFGLMDKLAEAGYVAKDTSTNGHAPGTYWGGHQTLIITVLGQDPEALSEAELRTAQRKIKRAIQELKDAGAVTLASSASRGRTAVYRVHPDEFTKDETCG